MTIAEDSLKIYEAYPRKAGKLAALKAIGKALKTVSVADLLEATLAYAESVKGKDKSFIPHPATWYNQGRYEDPIEVEKQLVDKNDVARLPEYVPRYIDPALIVTRQEIATFNRLLTLIRTAHRRRYIYNGRQLETQDSQTPITDDYCPFTRKTRTWSPLLDAIYSKGKNAFLASQSGNPSALSDYYHRCVVRLEELYPELAEVKTQSLGGAVKNIL